MPKRKPTGGVSIANVTGDVQGNIFAGGDVSNATITLGGKEVQANKEPKYEEFVQLIREIQEELAKISAEQQKLKEISAGTPSLIQAAGETVDQVAGDVQKEEPAATESQTIKGRLEEASNTISLVLSRAKTISEKTVEAGKAIEPIVNKLIPILKKLGVAALWASKLWLPG